MKKEPCPFGSIDNCPYYGTPGWISVKDRSPEKDGEYLTYCNDSKNGNIDVDPFYNDDDSFPYGVTHWQPLPAPPEEEG